MFLKKEKYINDPNPVIDIPPIELYDFVKKHNLITNMNFVDKDINYDCVICMDDNDNCYSLQKCGHIFHQKCILKWNRERKGECPICKNALFENAINSWYADELVKTNVNLQK